MPDKPSSPFENTCRGLFSQIVLLHTTLLSSRKNRSWHINFVHKFSAETFICLRSMDTKTCKYDQVRQPADTKGWKGGIPECPWFSCMRSAGSTADWDLCWIKQISSAQVQGLNTFASIKTFPTVFAETLPHSTSAKCAVPRRALISSRYLLFETMDRNLHDRGRGLCLPDFIQHNTSFWERQRGANLRLRDMLSSWKKCPSSANFTTCWALERYQYVDAIRQTV